MDNRPIGVFDSGVGGLTTVKELTRIMPGEDIVYFGDTGRVPYGTRSKQTIAKYAMQDVDFLKKHNVKMIIAACGTVSTNVADDKIAKAAGVPYTGAVLPAAQAACAASPTGKIGVIGTTATVRSGMYGKLIRNIRPDAKIVGNSCPLFVPLVENGYIDFENQVTRLVAKDYLEPIIREKVDTLILGCTHYPVIYDIINDLMGYEVTLIDAGKETARFAQRCLTENGLLHEERQEAGEIQYYVTDTPEGFEEIAYRFLGVEAKGKVQMVDIDTL